VKDDIGFLFQEDSTQQWDGFNDSGIEHFTGNPLEHLGREVPQNTIDAQSKSPVKIHIRLLEVPTPDIPGIDELRAVVAACKAGAGTESDKATAFFASATAMLKQATVPVLQIKDSNTTGVTGPCSNGKPYFAFMKAAGQSKKTSDSDLGSYGIGKFAPYTVSGLRTIFVSTVWNDIEANQLVHYTQGKSILTSHEMGGKTFRGTGFWGIKNQCQPVEGFEHVPAWLWHGDPEQGGGTGTTLNILGFSGRKNWKKVLAANIAENFFGAVSDGHLEVEIDDEPPISAATIGNFFADSAAREAMKEQTGEPEKFDHVREYLKCLGTEGVIVEDTQNLHLGRCEVRIRIGEGLPKRVAVLRNGMLITESLPNLRQFGNFKDFIAVLQCRDDTGNKLLRAMEPPRHDTFEPDRLPEAQRAKGRLALRDLGKAVRDIIAKHAKNPVEEVSEVDELAPFFGDESDESGGKKGDEENPQGAVIVRARRLPKPKPTRAKTAEEDDLDEGSESGGGPFGDGPGSGGGGDGGGGGGGGGGSKEGTGGGSTRGSSKPVNLANVRALGLAVNRRRINFTPSSTGTISLEFQEAGADTNYLLPVSSGSEGAVDQGKLAGVPVVAGQRKTLEVEFAREFTGTLRIVANAV